MKKVIVCRISFGNIFSSDGDLFTIITFMTDNKNIVKQVQQNSTLNNYVSYTLAPDNSKYVNEVNVTDLDMYDPSKNLNEFVDLIEMKMNVERFIEENFSLPNIRKVLLDFENSYFVTVKFIALRPDQLIDRLKSIMRFKIKFRSVRNNESQYVDPILVEQDILQNAKDIRNRYLSR